MILMDQRGVGHSQPALDCPEAAQFCARSVGLRYDAASTSRLLVDAASACRQRLGKAGIEFGAYNPIDNAADFADLRVVLKIAAWNVYGASYSTDLGQPICVNIRRLYAARSLIRLYPPMWRT